MNNNFREISMKELLGAISKLDNDEMLELDINIAEREFVMKLVSLRKAKGFTQSEVASRTGLTQQQISMLEKVQRSPRLDTLIRYCKGIDVDIVVR